MADEDIKVGGVTVAADLVEVEGETKRVGRSKIGFGAPGSYADVSDAAPLPVEDTGLAESIAELGEMLAEQPETVGGKLVDAAAPGDGDGLIYDGAIDRYRTARPTLLDLDTYMSPGGDVAAAMVRAKARISAGGGQIVFSARPGGAAYDLHGVPITLRSGVEYIGQGAASVVTSTDAINDGIVADPTHDTIGAAIRKIKFVGGAVDAPLVGGAPRRDARGVGASPSFQNVITVRGDNHPDQGYSLVRDFEITDCVFENVLNEPFILDGIKGLTRTEGCKFYNTLDPGWLFCENIISGSHYSERSGDNGFSYSRGNTNMALGLHIVRDCAYAAMWLAGFNADAGPHHFTLVGLVARNCGYYFLDFHKGAHNGQVGFVYGDGALRALPEDALPGSPNAGKVNNVGVGIVFTGNPDQAVPDQYADEVHIDHAVLRNCQRGGVLYRGAKRLSFKSLEIINPGTEFMNDGTTTILGTPAREISQNFGVLDEVGNSDHIHIEDLVVRDDRTVPFATYPAKLQATTTNARIGTVKSEGTKFTLRDGMAQDAGNSNITGSDEDGKTVQTGTVAAASFGSQASIVDTINEVRQLVITATAGTLIASIWGEDTAALAFNITGPNLQTALEGLVGTGNVTVTVPVAGTYNITFAGALAAQPVPLLIKTGSLTGGTATVTVTATGARLVTNYREYVLVFPTKFKNAPRVFLAAPRNSTGVRVSLPALSNISCTIRVDSNRSPITAPDIDWRAVGV